MRQSTRYMVSGVWRVFSKLPMRQSTELVIRLPIFPFSKLPMRQSTPLSLTRSRIDFSKLPMRQSTKNALNRSKTWLSKLPMRQSTVYWMAIQNGFVSKLPMRQSTAEERKARRYVRRHEGVSYEDALGLLDRRKETYDLPFIQMKSLSTAQTFSLFIKKTPCQIEQSGTLSTYGLSDSASVPEF